VKIRCIPDVKIVMKVAVRKMSLMFNEQIKNLWQAGVDNIEPDHF